MPKYRLTLDDGRVITATADNEADATSAAQSWAGANPKAAKRSPSIGDEIVGAVAGSVDKLKKDAAAHVKAEMSRKPSMNLADFSGTKRMAGLIGDVAGVAMSPVAGLIHGAIVKPGADLLDKIPVDAYSTPDVFRPSTWNDPIRKLSPEEKHASNEGMINTALMGAGPGRTGGMIRPAPPPSRVATSVEKFDRAKVTPMLAASGGRGTSAATNLVAENPIAGGLVRSRMSRALTETQASAEGLATRYGETRGPQITGENVQKGVTRFARDRRDPKSFKAKSSERYDQVFGELDTAMAGKQQPGASQISTSATSRVLNEVNSSTQSAAIGDLVADPTLNKAASALSSAQGAKDLAFGDLRRLRTWVRDAQKDPELRQKIGPANLQRLEGALTTDIYENASRLGSPELAQRLRRADQYYAAGQARIENALQSFADAQSGESAYRRIEQAAGSTGSADAAKLLSLKRSLAPEEWGDVASNLVSDMGKPTPGQAAASDAGFSVARFVTRYNQLSPRGKNILFGAVGGGGAKASALRSELDNLAEVADALKGIEKGANVSKTAVAGQTLATGAGLLNPSTTIPTAAGLSAMALTGEVMTNPLLVRWLARLGKAQAAGPKATSAVVKQLQLATRTNAALMPLYQESVKLLPPPIAARAAAEDRSQEGSR